MVEKRHGADDMMPPARTEGQPQPIRHVRRDMLHDIAHKEVIGVLDTANWLMARSYEEKRRLIVDGLAQPEHIIIAWSGGRWTDFFEFPDDEALWETFISALTPRKSVMLTEDELEVVRAHRQGALPRVTGRRRKT